MPSANPGFLSPWKMRKPELIQELAERKITFHPSWTVPELRALVIEARERDAPADTPNPLKGITRMCLEDLVETAKKMGIQPPVKVTRGWLLMEIRKSKASPADTVVPFGRFRGWLYKEVPADYLQWAIREVATKGEQQSHPDLVRLSNWAIEHFKTVEDKKANSSTVHLVKDPEVEAVTPIPNMEDMLPYPGSRKASQTPKAKPFLAPKKSNPGKGRKAESSDSSWIRMDDTEPVTAEEIKELEDRLLLLRTRRAAETQIVSDDETERAPM